MDSGEDEYMKNLIIKNALLDNTVTQLQQEYNCKVEACKAIDLELAEYNKTIVRLEAEVNALNLRQKKSLENVEGLKREVTTRKSLNQSLGLQLQSIRSENAELILQQRAIIDEYRTVWEQYKKKYENLPWIKNLTRIQLNNEILKIDLKVHKQKLFEEERKVKLLNLINHQRIQLSVIELAKVSMDLEAAKKMCQENQQKKRTLQEDNKNLIETKKKLLDDFSKKTKSNIDIIKHKHDLKYAGHLPTSKNASIFSDAALKTKKQLQFLNFDFSCNMGRGVKSASSTDSAIRFQISGLPESLRNLVSPRPELSNFPSSVGSQISISKNAANKATDLEALKPTVESESLAREPEIINDDPTDTVEITRIIQCADDPEDAPSNNSNKIISIGSPNQSEKYVKVTQTRLKKSGNDDYDSGEVRESSRIRNQICPDFERNIPSQFRGSNDLGDNFDMRISRSSESIRESVSIEAHISPQRKHTLREQTVNVRTQPEEMDREHNISDRHEIKSHTVFRREHNQNRSNIDLNIIVNPQDMDVETRQTIHTEEMFADRLDRYDVKRHGLVSIDDKQKSVSTLRRRQLESGMYIRERERGNTRKTDEQHRVQTIPMQQDGQNNSSESSFSDRYLPICHKKPNTTKFSDGDHVRREIRYSNKRDNQPTSDMFHKQISHLPRDASEERILSSPDPFKKPSPVVSYTKHSPSSLKVNESLKHVHKKVKFSELEEECERLSHPHSQDIFSQDSGISGSQETVDIDNEIISSNKLSTTQQSGDIERELRHKRDKQMTSPTNKENVKSSYRRQHINPSMVCELTPEIRHTSVEVMGNMSGREIGCHSPSPNMSADNIGASIQETPQRSVSPMSRAASTPIPAQFVMSPLGSPIRRTTNSSEDDSMTPIFNFSNQANMLSPVKPGSSFLNFENTSNDNDNQPFNLFGSSQGSENESNVTSDFFNLF